MPLIPGTRLGPYEIGAQIGVGGMGEVYRATDRNLGREVAIKVLPDAFAQDAERLARFEREARTLASLNHPNIAIIHGLERGPAQAGHYGSEVRALVMEFVAGPTLADRIAQRSIPLDEALPIARQIAEALEAAHEQGIVHRDLKPANVKVREDGTVKVLDFGLAKMIDDPAKAGHGDLSQSPTITTPAMTQLGMILGTAAYMAPEQARGKAVDKRSDIWAFGCVLFEMLTGKKTFDGDDVTDTIAAVVRAEPKWDALPAEVSASIRLLLRRCMEKDRKKRIGDISTVLFVINEQASLPTATSPTANALSRQALWKYLSWSALAVVVAGALGAVGVWTLTRPEPPRTSRLELNTFGTSRLALYTNNFQFAMTDDGSRVIYMGGAQGAPPNLLSRRLDQLESTMLAERVSDPFVSPDGRWVGFGSMATMRKVAVTGGSSLDVAPLRGGLVGATWGHDDTIVFATTSRDTGLLRVPSSGGEPAVLTRPDNTKGEGDHILPRWLPGGNAVLFTVTAAVGLPDSATSQIAVLDLRSPGAAPKIVLRGGSDARYVPTGHLVYLAGGSLWAVPFDVDQLEVEPSSPVQVLASVASEADVNGLFEVAADGTLAYLPATAMASPERQLVWVDRSGKEEVLAAPPKPYAYPRISPDGSRVAFELREQANDIWTWDLVRKGFTRVTKDPGGDRTPLWLDAERIIYTSAMLGIPRLFLQRADGSGLPEQLSDAGGGAGGGHNPVSLSPDGKSVVFVLSGGPRGNDVMLLHLDRRVSTQAKESSSARPDAVRTVSLREMQPLVSDAGAQGSGVISPDGRWLAYQSNESGVFEIYVRPFTGANTGLRHIVSTDTGAQPRWSANGRELFYVSLRNNAMMSVQVGTGATWSAGTPEKLFDASSYSIGPTFPYLNYDLAKDGRFLMVKPLGDSVAEGEATASLVVVQNWFEELKRLVPAK